MQHYAQVRMIIIYVFNENNNRCPNLYLPEGYYRTYISCSSLQFNTCISSDIHILEKFYSKKIDEEKYFLNTFLSFSKPG